MPGVAGQWDTVVKSPLGEQRAVMTVEPSGDGWIGNAKGATTVIPCTDGKIDGNTLSWKMSMTVPMPMTLDCKATVDGDVMTGSVTAGPFGSFPLTGTRLG